MCNKLVSSYIPIAISFASLIISIFVLIRDSWKERFNLKCEKVKWFASMVKNQPFYIWMIISNHSKLPVSILKMELSCNRKGETFSAISRGEKHLIMSKNRDDKSLDVYSCDYPICIDGYSSFGSYIHFASETGHFNFEGQDVIVTLYTNRGKKRVKMSLDYGDNIYRVMLSLSGEGKVTKHADGSPIQYQYDGV